MRLLIIAALGLVALTGLAFVTSTTVVAQEGAEAAEYVGSDACKKCHFKQHRYWKKTSLFTALETLKASEDAARAEKMKAAGLDPAKDYSTDATCLACHTTGYGKKGGFPEKDATAEQIEDLGMVGCESCHGPGSLYVKHKTEALEKDKESKFDFDGLSKYGLVKPNADNCATCHNEKNPVHPGDFDFEANKGVHEKKKK